MKNNKQSAMNTNHCVQTDVGATQHRIHTHKYMKCHSTISWEKQNVLSTTCIQT